MTNEQKRVEVSLLTDSKGYVPRARFCKIMCITEEYFRQLCEKHNIKIEKMLIGSSNNRGLIRNMISENGAKTLVKELIG